MPPVVAGAAAVIASFGASAAVATVAANVLVYGAIAFGSAILSRALAPEAPAGEAEGPGGTELDLSADPSHPRTLILGRRAVAGSLVYWATAGNNNKDAYLVIALADHRIESLDRVWVDGKEVTWAPTTVDVNGVDIPEYRAGNGTSRMKIWFRRGSASQPAIGQVINASPPRRSGGGSEWTEAHRLDGIAYVVVQLGYDTEVFKSGGIPAFLFEVKGAQLRDPRTGIVAWTENLEVARYNYLRGINVGTDGQPMFGAGISDADINLDAAIAAANACDEKILLRGGGREERYRVSAVITSDMTHRAVFDKFALACAGDVPDLSGKYAMMPGVAQVPVVSISDGDLVAGEELTGSRHISRKDKANEVVGEWADPEALYQRVPVPARWSPADEAADGGFRHADSFDLDFVASQTQGQRVLEIMRRLERRQRAHTITLPRTFAYLEAGDWITWNSNLFGYNGQTFRVEQVTLQPDWKLTLQIREIDSGVYAWDPATDEIDPERPQPLASAGPPVTVIPVTSIDSVSIGGGGGSERPGIRVNWADPDDPTIVALRIEYRRIGDVPWLEFTTRRVGLGFAIITQGIGDDELYEARLTPITEPRRIVTTSPVFQALNRTPVQVVRRVKEGAIRYIDLDPDTQSRISSGGTGGGDIDTTAPDTPGDPTLTSSVETRRGGGVDALVRVEWPAVTSANLAYYEIEIAFSTNGTTTSWGSFVNFATAQNYYEFRNLRPGNPVRVRVRSVSRNGYKSGYTTIIVHTVAANTTPPGSATSLTASAAFQNVFLRWVNPSDIDLDFVRVYESATPAFADASAVAIARGSSFTRTGLTAGQTRYYWVETVNTSGIAGARTPSGNGLAATTAQVNGPDIVDAAITATKIADGAVTARKLIIGDFDNLAENADFSLGDPGWTLGTNGSAIVNNPTHALTGKNVLQVPAGASAGLVGRNNLVNEVRPNDVIYAEVWSKQTGGVDAGLRLRIVWLDGNRVAIASTGVAIPNPGHGVYHRAFVTGVVPSGAAYAQIELSLLAPLTIGNWWIGRVFMHRQNGGELIVDGAITTQHMTANTINGDRIQAGTLDANRVTASSVLAGNIVVGATGDTLATVRNNALSGAETATNFNKRNDRNTKTPDTPVFNRIDHIINEGGSADINFRWSYSTSNDTTASNNIDGFLVYVRVTVSDATTYVFGTTSSEETVFVIPSDQRNFYLSGGNANSYYNFAVQAYRSVDTDLVASGEVRSSIRPAANALNPYQPSSNVVYKGRLPGAGGATFLASDVAGWANDPASRVNALTTVIAPGKILIKGATTLADWRNGGDSTEISGGAIAANTIAANKIEIGSRGITIEGLEFSVNKSVNRISWGAGTISYTNDSGGSNTRQILAGSALWASGTLYVYWTKNGTELLTATSRPSGALDVVLATYRGGSNIVANYGRTLIDGDHIATNTITAANIAANTITAKEIATDTITARQIAANTITAAQIKTGAITANEISTRTITANEIVLGGITYDELASGAVTGHGFGNVDINTAVSLNMRSTGRYVTTLVFEGVTDVAGSIGIGGGDFAPYVLALQRRLPGGNWVTRRSAYLPHTIKSWTSNVIRVFISNCVLVDFNNLNATVNGLIEFRAVISIEGQSGTLANYNKAVCTIGILELAK